MDTLSNLLVRSGAALEFAATAFREAAPIRNDRAPWLGGGDQAARIEDADGAWTIAAAERPLTGTYGGVAAETLWTREGTARETAVELRLRFAGWSTGQYVLVPGAVYNGNRFEVYPTPYAPCWSKIGVRGADAPALVTDVPRLAIGTGESAFHLLAGDAATPAVAIYDPVRGRGFIAITDQSSALGDYSIHVEESADRSEACVVFRAPGVRPHRKYGMCTTADPSDDRGADFADGDRVAIGMHAYAFECPNVAGLFRALAEVRYDRSGLPRLAETLPFSAAWAIQEEKYNRMNWNETFGYYAVGTVDQKHQDWQLGWVGGGMSSYALLLEGSGPSAERAMRTLDFIFSGQTEAGWFPGVFYNGSWYGDEFDDSPDRYAPERWHIVRKSADALYFLAKHMIALETTDPPRPLKAGWIDGVRRLADAFVRLWREHGQFGQWLDHETGELLVGGSAGGAMAIGGLSLVGEWLGDDRYRAVALEAGESYYVKFTAQGLTLGGPGEILQNPDSESAFALLESFVALHEATGDRVWLSRAEEAAAQAMSWCVTYDFAFPRSSTFGKLGMRTAGSVIANVQNKHSAPGICTLSGDALLKLYRATGDPLYVRQLRETTRNLNQYLSREDRPIQGWDGKPMPAGYMSERVNMSDWEGRELVGEALPLSCWCEASNLLAYAELPGIYAQPDTGLLVALDHVTCDWTRDADGNVVGLAIGNPTPYPAKVKLFAERSADAARRLGIAEARDWPRIAVGPGETVAVGLRP